MVKKIYSGHVSVTDRKTDGHESVTNRKTDGRTDRQTDNKAKNKMSPNFIGET